MGPYFEGGLEWCYNWFIRIPTSGPVLGDHRIYFAFMVIPITKDDSMALQCVLKRFQTEGRGRGP